MKRYLKTPEEVTQALKEGKVVLDRTGNKYKSINGFIVVSYISGGWGVDPFIGNHEGLYVDEPEPLKLEVGKFYKTRDGKKAIILNISEFKNCYVAIVGTNSTYYVGPSGLYSTDRSENDYDLVAPWEE